MEFVNISVKLYEILVSHSSVIEDSVLLGCDAMLLVWYFLSWTPWPW